MFAAIIIANVLLVLAIAIAIFIYVKLEIIEESVVRIERIFLT